MAADIEKLLRRWLSQTEAELNATPADVARCQAAFVNLKQHVEELLGSYFPPIKLSARLWSDALLRQADADLHAAEALAREGGSASVLCMLLQMVFEKLAKAALARFDAQCFIAFRVSHAAASRLVSTIKNHGAFVDLRYKWRDVLPLVQALERAHPALARGGPHLEYPWEAGDRMGLPEELPIVRQFDDPLDPKGPRLLRFARELHDRFDELFP
ncbi:hypothetical protein [Sorangium cellulosum]|uniref:HEPN domain-containing protein n=1 Tax=Sorangium cellulosum So0157-2 TaxID=1254432 RepID=S4YAE8_SORCE|nr:hypothetical protein [Sorangium cellulosum]AGP41864.1 hypothetical protein SCE1572_49660 [Sorangium cellulosum So0157-2]